MPLVATVVIDAICMRPAAQEGALRLSVLVHCMARHLDRHLRGLGIVLVAADVPDVSDDSRGVAIGSESQAFVVLHARRLSQNVAPEAVDAAASRLHDGAALRVPCHQLLRSHNRLATFVVDAGPDLAESSDL